jgi:hypothetical protein
VSEATIRRFRNDLGEDWYNEIVKELLRIGVKVGALKKRFGIGDYRYDCSD